MSKFEDHVVKNYIMHDIMSTKEMYNKFHATPSIKNVIFNPPATIVFWTDGTKTVVKAENEDFDPEKGLAMAISKKMLGNKGNYYETFKKWLPKENYRDVYFDLAKSMDELRDFVENMCCSTCARFDDENMACMISQPCIGYDKYVKKDTHE